MSASERRFKRREQPLSHVQTAPDRRGPHDALNAELVDAAILAYVEWREECAVVWDAYGGWRGAEQVDRRLSHGGYVAALEREAAAATAYALALQRVGELVAAP